MHYDLNYLANDDDEARNRKQQKQIKQRKSLDVIAFSTVRARSRSYRHKQWTFNHIEHKTLIKKFSYKFKFNKMHLPYQFHNWMLAKISVFLSLFSFLFSILCFFVLHTWKKALRIIWIRIFVQEIDVCLKWIRLPFRKMWYKWKLFQL